MVAEFERNARNPLLIPEIVGLVINNIHNVPDLLSCAGVNSIWNVAALKKLYKGSLNDMQLRTPDIGSLNCLFVASRKQFARNMSFVKHLLLSPEIPAIDEVEVPHTRLPRGRGLSSLTIPFEIKDQNWSLFPDFLINPTIEFLAIDSYYCKLMVSSQELIKASSVATEWRRIFPKLRGIPCPGDLYSQSMQEDELGEEIQGDSAGLSVDEEVSSTEPSLDWDDYDPDWFIFRTKLWKVLGYRKDLLIHDKIQYMWQTYLEIEMVRWPIVPLAAFSDPDLHSTTTICSR
ncbi:hypothetical protein AtubIFM55763_001766 [Aspergillus tubingensis]|nr:hypothetical protein AtubIFM55763_001766 [Aspergillus tubingensis]